MAELNSESVSPLSYLKVFFRRKELFIVPTFIGLTMGICTGLLLPKKYRSSTVILVEEGKSDNPLFTNIAVSTTVTQRLTAIRESMLGWYNLVQLVKRLNLDKEVKTIPEFERLILGIRRNIIIELRGQNIIELSYVGDNPDKTQAVVQNITDIFIEKNVEKQNQETADAITFIENLLKVYRGKIKSAEIANLEEQLLALLVDSTENHPRVKLIREQIELKKEELRREDIQYTEGDTLKAETNNPIIDEIKKSLDVLESQKKTEGARVDPQQEMYKVMLIDKLDKVMARDVGVNSQIYNMLLQRLETAKITQRLQSSKEGTKYTILDPPRVPQSPFYPKKPLIALMGLFLGALAGAGLVIAVEFLDKSFIDVSEAKEYLGVPLLGAISKINTVETIRQEREKKAWIYVFMVVGGIVMILVTVTISNFLKS